jgi:predicted PurR-regulated permease PerM
MDEQQSSTSPRWSGTAKLVVALLSAIILIYILYRFQTFLAPLLLSFLIAYLVHPLAKFLHERLKIPWRVISTILFLLIFLMVIGLITWGGISIVEQVQNLLDYLQKLVGQLPEFIDNLTHTPLVIGTFSIDLSRFEMNDVWTQLQGVVEPILSGAGSLIGSIASGAATTVVGLIFIILIAYFIMIESGGMRDQMIKLSIPKYQDDIRFLGSQISKIWNAFLRGQLLVFMITVIVYSILLSILGVRYFFMLALLAGLARFVPYVGPFVAWTTYALVALFQTNYLGLRPFPFALIVVGCAWVTDVIMDNFVSPRVMSNALKIHPAAVLVMVFISGSLFGFIGVLLSAPLLASIQLIATYILRKLMDLDPWEGLETIPPARPFKEVLQEFWVKITGIFNKKQVITKVMKKDKSEKQKTNLQKNKE